MNFTISYKTSQFENRMYWFGIGMNKQPAMNMSDAIIIRIDEGKGTLMKSDWNLGPYSIGEFHFTDDTVGYDRNDNWYSVFVTRKCNEGDINICDDHDFYWLFPYSGGPLAEDLTIQMHTQTPGIVKAARLKDCTNTATTESPGPQLCFNNEVVYRYPEHCTEFDSDCYVVQLTYVKIDGPSRGTIQLSVSFKSSYSYSNQKKWFGIGMNTEPSMSGADALIITIENGQILTKDDWKVGFYSAGAKDTINQDFFVVYDGVSDNWSFVVAERSCDVINTQEDVDLCSGEFYWIFPYSGGPVGDDGEIQMHTQTPAIVKYKSLWECQGNGITNPPGPDPPTAPPTENPYFEKVKEVAITFFGDLVDWAMSNN